MKLFNVMLPTGQKVSAGSFVSMAGGFVFLIVALATAQRVVGMIAPVASRIPGGIIDTGIDPIYQAPPKAGSTKIVI